MRVILEFFTALRGTIVVTARRVGVRNLSIAAAGVAVTCLAVGVAVEAVDAWLGDDPDIGSLLPEKTDGASGGLPPVDVTAASPDRSTDAAAGRGDRSHEVGGTAPGGADDGTGGAGEGDLPGAATAGPAGGPQPASASPGGAAAPATTAGGAASEGEGVPVTTEPSPTTGPPTTTAPASGADEGGGVLGGLLDLLGLG